MTRKNFEKLYKTEVVNDYKGKVFLTKELVKRNFVFDEWISREEFTVYWQKSFFGLFTWFRKYTSINAYKVFDKFDKLKRKY